MIQARFIIQTMGTPKSLLEKTIQTMLKTLKETYKTKDEHIEKPTKTGKELYASFLEITIEFKTLEEYFLFMISYTPTSAEIIKPYKFEISAGELENFSNDFLGKLHDLDKQLKTQKALNKILARKTIRSNQNQKK